MPLADTWRFGWRTSYCDCIREMNDNHATCSVKLHCLFVFICQHKSPTWSSVCGNGPVWADTQSHSGGAAVGNNSTRSMQTILHICINAHDHQPPLICLDTNKHAWLTSHQRERWTVNSLISDLTEHRRQQCRSDGMDRVWCPSVSCCFTSVSYSTATVLQTHLQFNKCSLTFTLMLFFSCCNGFTSI